MESKVESDHDHDDQLHVDEHVVSPSHQFVHARVNVDQRLELGASRPLGLAHLAVDPCFC